MSALFTIRGTRLAMVALVALATCGFLATSQASADLVLDVVSGTSSTYSTAGSLIAVTPTQSTVTVSLWGSVMTGGVVNSDGNSFINSFLYSVYSSNAGSTTGNPVGLTHVSIGQITTVAGYPTNPLTGTVTKPTSADLDGDGDMDRGSTDNGLAAGWGILNFGTYFNTDEDGNPIGNPIPNYSSGPQYRLGSMVLTLSTGQTWGHGITQIWMVGSTEGTVTQWLDNGTEHSTPQVDVPTTGNKVTLYQVATAHNTSPTVNITSTGGSGTLDGSTSVGTMDHWKWYVRPVGDVSPSDWILVGDVNTPTFNLTLAALQTLPGGGSLPLGTYDVELVTTYNSAVTLPNDNMSTSPDTEQTLLNYTPEPGTILFLMAGSAGLAMFRRRRSRK